MIEIMKTFRFKRSIELWERNTLKHKQKRARYTHNCKKEVGVAYGEEKKNNLHMIKGWSKIRPNRKRNKKKTLELVLPPYQTVCSTK